MKLQVRLFASACILLLLPMTANAILITYTSNNLGNAHYLTAEVDVTSAAPGLYSETNGGLTSFTMTAFDINGVIRTASAPPSTAFDNYVLLDANGALQEWFLFADEGQGRIYTLNHVDDANGGCCPSQQDLIDTAAGPFRLVNSPGVWSDVPEPGTLALLAAGVGFMYRRKTIGDRI